MRAYILAHWVEWLFTVCIAILTFAWRTVATRLKLEIAKNEAIADGVQSLLRESLIGNYQRYKKKGYCPIYARQNIEGMYEAYSRLGKDGTTTGLYKELMELPTEEPSNEGQP